MANIINLDRVSKGYGAPGRCSTDVSLGLGRRRPDRRGRPQRRRQVHPAAAAHQAGGARHRPGHPPPRPAGACAAADARPSPPTPPSATWWSATPGCRGHRAPSTSGPATPASAPSSTDSGMPRPRPRHRRSARCPAASAAGSRWPRCWSATPTCSCSTSPPTTSTSTASTGWPSTCSARAGALVVVTHDRWFLDAVCDRTWEVADQTVRAVRGRLRGLGPRPRRADPGRRRHRGPPAEPAAQGDRLAAPRPAGPYVQAEVPHRRRQRADRRRARAARHGVAAAAWPPPGSASRSTTCAGRRPYGSGPERDPRRRRPGRSARATGSASSAATAPASRRCCGCSPATSRPTAVASSVGSTVRSAYLSQELAELPGDLRVLEAVEEVARRVDLGGRELTAGAAGRGVRLHRPSTVDPGRRPVRWRAPPAAAAAAARRRAERAAARRAHQRPRHRHPGLAGGPARHVARHDDRRVATTGTWSSGSATRCSRCSATGG